MNIAKLFPSQTNILAKAKIGKLLNIRNYGMPMSTLANVQDKKLIYVNKPVHGGMIYWKCRDMINTIKKKTKRCARYLELNHDFGRATLVGVPKTSYDPKNNIIYIQMDNEEWAGIGSKVMLNISMNILFYLHISFWIYFIYYRMLVNNKLNVFSKWKDAE
ncbi:cytochrome c oxidase subunit ApiCOX14, putative [Plasmodium yoelii]|nr:cytochrome c oxidase subunit ApiCOX14, putative [Plasmodium yoelii]CDU20195.1 conserved Plasmodium protein, unknown function [Plasmodium yoelii]VTZ80953.1 cytochrome c oxidase subunit ApiCOX14, putative [Plasmodium yoelii]|eukprot:XP_022813724.1 cytochrome c oxidase subunit ApiCOX14, putative [Plasmodium yoelii]